MKEKLISYNTAVLAKEKGFDIKVQNAYSCKRKTRISPHDSFHLRPTQSLLAKWLMKKHGIFVYVTPVLQSKMYTEYKFNLYRLTDNFRLLPCGIRDTYEEALEEGVYQALNLLP